MTEAVDFNVARWLEAQQEAVLDAWMSDIVSRWKKNYLHVVDTEHLHLQSRQLLEEIRKLFVENPNEFWEPTPDSKIVVLIRSLSTQRAKQGFKPADSTFYVLSLKRVLWRRLLQDRIAENKVALATCLAMIENVIDRLTLLIYEVYVETRERLIAQQSLSLLELSTPVVRLWDRVLMVPLIGVMDTQRARQTTERLLEAIAKYEATVAILDVTGVPVLDTSVAGHIMKTIAAAQMLGARVVMTGISPDGAQTLVKLGVDFSVVTTRATLRAGVAESLLLVGKRIVAVKDAP
ncbi:STAS domain-containing protein [Candidatus Contendibacter odensensis]|uniref:Anti-sigma-factor antagonist n=1 Tax=Candidatus Contendobacter odensis Run_B_J11 TaxID=1400861 RepID=A0A7U7GEG6_9GAMM|nr:STAS domain-containing protein [Candidatus Contendobacter odensis]MBK8754098.1 STAS domain-containing protein [Candidatus Competibacteraceae bacterium]CDH46871.1 Anti-sigma-factor antagonist [Candidatus Contendobacter odensis Run_B_J11]